MRSTLSCLEDIVAISPKVPSLFSAHPTRRSGGRAYNAQSPSFVHPNNTTRQSRFGIFLVPVCARNRDYLHRRQQKEYRKANSDRCPYQPPAPAPNLPFIYSPATSTRPQCQPSQNSEWQCHVKGNHHRCSFAVNIGPLGSKKCCPFDFCICIHLLWSQRAR